MKRFVYIIALLMALLLMVCSVACGKKTSSKPDNKPARTDGAAQVTEAPETEPTAAAEDETAAAAAGTYKCELLAGMTMRELWETDAIDAGYSSLEEALAALGYPADYDLSNTFVLELNDDGTGNAANNFADDNIVQELTWTQNGDTITMVVGGETIEADFDGETISFTTAGTEMVFRRA